MERDGGHSETDLAQSASLRRADGLCKPLWHTKKKAPRGTCFLVCNVQVADGVGLISNLLHLMNILIICFDYKSEQAPTAIPDAFNKDRWLH